MTASGRTSLLRAAFVAAVGLVVVLIARGGEDPYIAKLELRNAGGLKDGSPVTIGGVKVGKVDVDVDPERRRAIAELKIDREYAPLGRDASVAVVARNLLGQKSVNVTPGDPKRPAPSGTLIAQDRVTEATDLDRVLSVLDADTRTRLAVFVNEAGAAFTGRRADFNRFLRQIAPAAANGTDVLQALGSENTRLREAVRMSDRFVAELTDRRDDVTRLVDRFGDAAAVSAGRRADLRRTLAEAPGALRTLQSFLGALRQATVPLGPAARRLSATAPPLTQALGKLDAFRRAAEPTLETAVKVAPDLTRLADGATPVLRQARPTVAALDRTVTAELPPVTDTVHGSINNTLSLLDNWAGAIQFRDKMSHIFRGEASFSPDVIQSAVNRLAPKPPRRRARRPRPTPQPSSRPGPQRPPSDDRLAKPKLPIGPNLLPKLEQGVEDLPRQVADVLDGLTGRSGGRPPDSPDDSKTLQSLLDYLLG